MSYSDPGAQQPGVGGPGAEGQLGAGQPGAAPPGYGQGMGQPGYGQPAHGQPTAVSGPSGPRAGFWQRFGAALLDGIILAVVNTILTLALKGVGYGLSILIQIAYFVYFEGGPTGQTLGKKAVGIRVVDFATGGPIGFGRAFIRYLGRIVSTIVIFLGYLWMLWDREKQCWHDKFASDVVVPVAAYPVPVAG